jgi:hypothetical protein
MTWIDFMKVYEPTIPDETADAILWSETAFPFASIKYTTYQIRSAIRSINNGISRCDLCGMKLPYHSHGCLNEKEK